MSFTKRDEKKTMESIPRIEMNQELDEIMKETLVDSFKKYLLLKCINLKHPFTVNKHDNATFTLKWIEKHLNDEKLQPSENIYLNMFNRVRGDIDINFTTGMLDDKAFKRYFAWAVPNNEAIQEIVKYSPVIELGAGKGYWASLVVKNGGLINCYDKEPCKNHYCDGKHFFHEVKPGSIEVLNEYDAHALFICWPNYAGSFAFDALKAFKGDIFIYVGESEGGCTGNDDFFKELEKNWREIKQVRIPQWWGIHDYMVIYQQSR